MRIARRLLVVLLPCLALSVRAGAEDLLVFAAASLADSLEELGRAWANQGGPAARFNFAGSNELARQIVAGAPADVFLSADQAQMDVVGQAGLVGSAPPAVLLSNLLVVVVPAGAAATVNKPEDLLAVRRLALADPQAVPAGVYARTWLESLGLWGKLRDKVLPALNVRAALSAVEAGQAQAGIVYRTDASLSKRVRVAFEVPREQGPRIVYVLAVLGRSRQPAAAEGFVRFLRSPEARRVFDRYGFLAP